VCGIEGSSYSLILAPNLLLRRVSNCAVDFFFRCELALGRSKTVTLGYLNGEGWVFGRSNRCLVCGCDLGLCSEVSDYDSGSLTTFLPKTCVRRALFSLHTRQLLHRVPYHLRMPQPPNCHLFPLVPIAD